MGFNLPRSGLVQHGHAPEPPPFTMFSTQAPCGLVMASVIRIQQAVSRKPRLVPGGGTMME
jgi:hypothetical protein